MCHLLRFSDFFKFTENTFIRPKIVFRLVKPKELVFILWKSEVARHQFLLTRKEGANFGHIPIMCDEVPSVFPLKCLAVISLIPDFCQHSVCVFTIRLVLGLCGDVLKIKLRPFQLATITLVMPLFIFSPRLPQFWLQSFGQPRVRTADLLSCLD